MWKIKSRQRYALLEDDSEKPRRYRGTFYIGPRHVKHYDTKEFVEFSYVIAPNFASEKNCRVFAQNSYVAIEVYDFYVKLFNPDYETVSVYDGRFDVQYLFKTTPKEDWRSVDYYNPTVQVIPLEDGIEIKKTFDTDYGASSLEISYIVRTGAFLKHTIVFTNKTTNIKTFRAVMKLTGITSTKITHKDGEERITAEKHIVSPFMFFGEDNNNLKLSEYLWRLGVVNEETGDWAPTTLKDIIFGVHAQGCKADIVIGNYLLAENESLMIDPTTDTFTVGASSDDCDIIRTREDFSLTHIYVRTGDYSESYYDYESGMRWTVDIPQGSSITSAYLKLAAYYLGGSIPTTIIEGEDVDEAATFSTAENYLGRDGNRTNANVQWTPPAWVDHTTYTSPDIKAIIQEIVDRVSFGTHIVLFWSHAIGWGGSEQRILAYSWDDPDDDPPKLEVTWEEAPVAGWKNLQYFSEPPTPGQFNKLRFASEPPVSGAWNKVLYEGE